MGINHSRRWAALEARAIPSSQAPRGFLPPGQGNYGGEEVRSRWHATAIETLTAAREIAREARPVFTAEQMEQLRHNLGLGNFVVQDYTPAQIEQMLRGPMSQLP